MKISTIQKIDELRRAGYDGAVLDKLLADGQTAIELFGKCELHPALHAFSALYQDKRDLGKEHEGCTIYGGEKPGDYLVDSVFDEIIDDIVGALENSCLKEK